MHVVCPNLSENVKLMNMWLKGDKRRAVTAPEFNAGHLSLNLVKGLGDVSYLVVSEDRLHNALILVLLNAVVHNTGHPEGSLVGDKRIKCIFVFF